MKLFTIVSASLLLGAFAFAHPAGQQPTPSAAKHDQPSEGEKLFETHCVRCHKPPDELPPRAAKAVLRHMRVRASLSSSDEQAILKYISPR